MSATETNVAAKLPHLQLFRLGPDDETGPEMLMQFIDRYKLTEVPLPDPEPAPDDHDVRNPLPLPQWLDLNKKRHGLTVRAFLHVANVGSQAKEVERRTVFVLRAKGTFWWSDATDFLEGLAGHFGKR